MNRHSNQNEGIRVLEEFFCQAVPDPSVRPSPNLKVEIDWPGVSLESVLDELGRALPAEHRARVALSVEPARRMSDAIAMDPALIGRTIQGVAMVLCPFFSALLVRMQEHKATSVVIPLPDKSNFELPTDASPEHVNRVATAVESAGCARMKIVE